MAYQPVSRYPSVWSGAASTEPDGGSVMIDGLEVVDEQVVVLSPLESRGTADRDGRPRSGHSGHARRTRGDGYGLG